MGGQEGRGWSEGYVTGVDYTRNYYRDLNPRAADLALLNAGFALPSGGEGACCELGFGFGVSANIHAAASGRTWWGTDFNPTQARYASDMAKDADTGARLFDESFAEFFARDDLPEFDFIGMHGTWTWLSDENRARIVDFVRRRLRVGGLLYISYNAQPGWAQMGPVRELMAEHAGRMTAAGAGMIDRIGETVEFMDALLRASPACAELHPAAASRIRTLKEQSRNYLAHEYFSRDWRPMLFTEFARLLEPAKAEFACSALYADHFERFNLTGEQAAFLARIRDGTFRQAVRDFMINRQFRKDYWVKGPLRLDPAERLRALRERRVLLAARPEDVSLRAGGALVEQDLPAAVYAPLLEQLADRAPRALGELEGPLSARGIPFEAMVEAIMVLIGKGDLFAVQDEEAIARAKAGASRLNLHLIERSATAADTHTLASPVTGGGIGVTPLELQILDARGQGLGGPGEWAGHLARSLAARGAGIVKSGGGIMTAAESVAAFSGAAEDFSVRRLPALRALGVVD